MAFYFIRCTLSKETDIAIELNKRLGCIDNTATIIFPRKVMIERLNNKERKVERPLIPGYLVMYAEADISKLIEHAKTVKGFQYVLHYKSDTLAYELVGKDKEYAQWVFGYDGIIEPSKVSLKPGESIKILEGPLLGLGGVLKKVSRRGNRVYVQVPMEENEILVSLAVDFVEKQYKW